MELLQVFQAVQERELGIADGDVRPRQRRQVAPEVDPFEAERSGRQPRPLGDLATALDGDAPAQLDRPLGDTPGDRGVIDRAADTAAAGAPATGGEAAGRPSNGRRSGGRPSNGRRSGGRPERAGCEAAGADGGVRGRGLRASSAAARSTITAATPPHASARRRRGTGGAVAVSRAARMSRRAPITSSMDSGRRDGTLAIIRRTSASSGTGTSGRIAADRGDGRLAVRRQPLHHRGPLIGRPAGQEVEQGAAEGVEIGPGVDAAGVEHLLGGHEVDRAEHGTREGQLGARTGQAGHRAARASPRSSTLTTPSAPRNRFDGLTSRWTMPRR